MEKKRKEAVSEVPIQEQALINIKNNQLTKILSKLINMNFEKSKIAITVTYLDH